jgi:hypothetical protein
MGYKNVAHLEEVFSGPPRDKVSTVYIDYLSEAIIADPKEYYRFGRCSLCSGFFTGNAENMSLFATKIIEKFMYYLELGYGHADEQLYSPVYFENRDLFELYYGDYFEMITNYRGLYDNVKMPLLYVMPKAAAAADWLTTYNVSKWLIHSKKGALTDAEYNHAALKWEQSAMKLGGSYLDEFAGAGIVVVDSL